MLAYDDQLLDQVFQGDRKKAYRDLVNYWFRTESELYPKANVKNVIKRLAQELDIPEEYNPFLNPKLRRITTPIK